MVQHALDQRLDILGDVSVGDNSQNNKFEQVEEERDGPLEEINAYQMEKK